MLGAVGKFLIGCLRAQITRTKTPVLAINFKVPMVSGKCESIHKPLYLSGIVIPIFIVTFRRFIFRSQKYFLLSSSPPTAMMTS
jgi:hypothetical protein